MLKMETQQFHLKWNNHSLNTLSSFQNLLDTNTLVDVSLTCSNGKTVTAHRMVLAACSEYFYRLFKDLPEKHPVIVFKDANEEIVRDLLLFMYKGEVEVQEAYLNDFLKFADTLQVKGLSQSDREEQQRLLKAEKRDHQGNPTSTTATSSSSSPVKHESKPINHGPPLNVPLPPAVTSTGAPPAGPGGLMPPELTKSYLASAGLGKFPPIFPLHCTEGPTDLLTSLSSPNLYRALQQKYQLAAAGAQAGAPGGGPPAHKFTRVAPLEGAPPQPPTSVSDNPLMKHMLINPPDLSALASMYPQPPPHHLRAADRDDNDNDSIAERSPPPSSHEDMENGSRTPAMDSDGGSPFPQGDQLNSTMPHDRTTSSTPHSGSEQPNPTTPHKQMGGSKPAGRGSRLERMIAAEYKIMSEYGAEAPAPEALPVMTPELMKSRRTHSLQLAIGEIMHNRASVQSAATKYHIPRETLRRHYQRYLKAMGIQPRPNPDGRSPGSEGSGKSTPATVRSAVTPTNNNAKSHASLEPPLSGDENSSNGFSSLMDIGAAYGIWNPDMDASDFKAARERAERVAASIAAASAIEHQRASAIAAAQAAAAQNAAAHNLAAANRERAERAEREEKMDEDNDKEKQLVIDERDEDRRDDISPPSSPIIDPVEHDDGPSPPASTDAPAPKQPADLIGKTPMETSA